MSSRSDSSHQRREFLKLAGAGAVASVLPFVPEAAGAQTELRRASTIVTRTNGAAIRMAQPLHLVREHVARVRRVEEALRDPNVALSFERRDPDRYLQMPIRPQAPRPASGALKEMPHFLREGILFDANRLPVLNLPPPGVVPFNKFGYKQTPPPASSWHAFDAPGTDASADTQIAVSSTHVVVTTHITAAFFDRSGNQTKAPFYIGDLFSSMMMSLGVTSIFDSRSIFDPYRKRFWIVTMGRTASSGYRTLMAVSLSEDPSDGFHQHWWDSGYDPADPADYPTLGIHEKCFIQSNTASHNGTGYLNVCFGDADLMAAGQNGNGWRFWDLVNPATGNPPDFIQPVSHHGSSPAMYLAGRDGDSLVVWAVTDPLGSGQSVTAGSFALTPVNAPTPAPQKGSSRPLWFERGGAKVMKAVYRAGSLYTVSDDAVNWFGDSEYMTSIRVVRAKLSGGDALGTNKPTSIDRIFGCNNVFDDTPTERFYYGYPAIEVGKSGDMAITYVRSGKDGYPEMRFSRWYHDDADILPSRQVKAGDQAYSLSWATPPSAWPTLPWADIAGACVDPVDDESIWIATCFATTSKDDNWGIWVAKV